MKNLKIKKKVFDNIKNFVEEKAPFESGGVLIGNDDNFVEEFIPLENNSNMKMVEFMPKPESLYKALSKTKIINTDSDKHMVGIVHSHPCKKGLEPSEKDVKCLGYKGNFLPIISNVDTDNIKCFKRIDKNTWLKTGLKVV